MGKVKADFLSEYRVRSISANAGKSVGYNTIPTLKQDHPRMHGEKQSAYLLGQLGKGSSPHARGKADKKNTGYYDDWIIPAPTGKRL